MGVNRKVHVRDDLDMRTRNLADAQRRNFTQRLRDTLGADYDVIDEGDRIHCEYDP